MRNCFYYHYLSTSQNRPRH